VAYQIKSGSLLLNSENMTMDRESVTNIINDTSQQMVLPILRDIRLCRLFGEDKERYQHFYKAKINDTVAASARKTSKQREGQVTISKRTIIQSTEEVSKLNPYNIVYNICSGI
jgi:hypothetical protein